MKHGFMDKMWNGLEKIRRDRKRCCGSGRMWKSSWRVFLTSRVLRIMNSNVRGKQWIAGIILKCWNIWEKTSGEKTSVVEKQLLLTPSWRRAHACIATDSWLFGQHEHTVLPQPPYSPDLAPADFYLLPKLKSTLKGRRFQTTQEITENPQTELHAISKKAYQDGFQKRQWRSERFINAGREYFEGHKAHSAAGMSEKL
jgi:hypothetical protein